MKKLKIYAVCLLIYTATYAGSFYYFYKFKTPQDVNAVWWVFEILNFPIMISNNLTYALFKVPLVAALANIFYAKNNNSVDLGIHYYLEGIIGYTLLYLFIIGVIWFVKRTPSSDKQ